MPQQSGRIAAARDAYGVKKAGRTAFCGYEYRFAILKKAAGSTHAGGLFVYSSALVLVAVLILVLVLILVVLILIAVPVLVVVLVVLVVVHGQKTSFPKTVQPYSCPESA